MNKKRITKGLKNLTEKIFTQNNPDKIVLFGSYAWGVPDRDSDVDICVIERTAGTRRERQLRLRHLAFGAGFPVDILSYTPKEVRDRLSRGDFFIKNILSKGTVLYERKSKKE